MLSSRLAGLCLGRRFARVVNRPAIAVVIALIAGIRAGDLWPGHAMWAWPLAVGAIVLFGILGAAVVSMTMLPALTVTMLEWGKRR